MIQITTKDDMSFKHKFAMHRKDIILKLIKNMPSKYISEQSLLSYYFETFKLGHQTFLSDIKQLIALGLVTKQKTILYRVTDKGLVTKIEEPEKEPEENSETESEQTQEEPSHKTEEDIERARKIVPELTAKEDLHKKEPDINEIVNKIKLEDTKTESEDKEPEKDSETEDEEPQVFKLQSIFDSGEDE